MLGGVAEFEGDLIPRAHQGARLRSVSRSARKGSRVSMFAIFPPTSVPAARDRRRSRCLHTSFSRGTEGSNPSSLPASRLRTSTSSPILRVWRRKISGPLSGLYRQKISQHASGNTMRHQGGKMRSQLVELRGRPTMQTALPPSSGRQRCKMNRCFRRRAARFHARMRSPRASYWHRGVFQS